MQTPMFDSLVAAAQQQDATAFPVDPTSAPYEKLMSEVLDRLRRAAATDDEAQQEAAISAFNAVLRAWTAALKAAMLLDKLHP